MNLEFQATILKGKIVKSTSQSKIKIGVRLSWLFKEPRLASLGVSMR